jgi:hypothetical protein
MSLASGNSAGNYFLKRIPVGSNAKAFFKDYVLTRSDETVLASAARDDSQRYLYNAVASFLGGLAGLQDQHVAWAITQMYYCSFYLGRAALCRAGQLIFHAPKEGTTGHTQFELKAIAGERATISNVPSTHKLVAARFKQVVYPAFMRHLTIEGLDPFEWMMEQREFWQYRSGRFSDPDSPTILDQVDFKKMPAYLATYIDDKRGLYLADPEHAVIALPFRLLSWSLGIDPLRAAAVVSDEDLAHLRRRCILGRQHITAISRYFHR